MLRHGALSATVARSFFSARGLQRTHLSRPSLGKSATRIGDLTAFLTRHASSAPAPVHLLVENGQQARVGGAEAVQDRPKRKGRLLRKSNEKKPPPAYIAEWKGMSPYRRYRMRLPDRRKPLSIAKMQDFTLQTALSSSIRAQGSVRHAAVLISSAERYRSSSERFKPPKSMVDELLVTLIESVVHEAEKQPDIELLSANGADVSCEALFRCLNVFGVRPSIAALTVLLRKAKHDPIVERRSERALSIFRYARAAQLRPTIDFLYEVFSVCVSGLDVEAAAIMMDFALANKIYREPRKDGRGPSQVDYYNGVMHAALLMGDHNTVETAHKELIRRELQPTDVTESMYLAMCFERRDERTARILLNAMQKRGGRLADCVYTSMLRAAGQRKDAESVRRIFGEWERARELKRGEVAGVVSAGRVGLEGGKGRMSDRAGAAAREDATFVVFEALRMCGAADEAVGMLEYLRREYGFVGARAVYVVVIETCWRAGKLELAKRLRREMEEREGMRTRALGRRRRKR